MSNFLRPEALAAILRWRETAVGAAATGFGLWWALSSSGADRWVGAVVALGGAAVLRSAVVRLRRPGAGGGAGIVVVTERQITYLSGHGGGAVSLDTLTRVALRQEAGPPEWRLSDADGHVVAIPSNAENAGAIFDALVALPGLAEEGIQAGLRDASRGERVLWQRDAERLG